MEKFDNFWNDLLIDLKTPKKIKNWTEKKGYFGEDFSAQINSDNQIICITPDGSVNHAKKSDFEWMYGNWEGYLSGRIQRQYLREKSFVVKYTISIIHQFIK
jgi:hypothetical protein